MSRYFQLLISEEFVERTIPEDDSVRLLDQIVDELDLHSLACSYSRMGRKSATSPRTLLKIMIYANMEGIYLVLCQDSGHIKPLFFSKISKMHKLVAFIPRFA